MMGYVDSDVLGAFFTVDTRLHRVVRRNYFNVLLMWIKASVPLLMYVFTAGDPFPFSLSLLSLFGTFSTRSFLNLVSFYFILFFPFLFFLLLIIFLFCWLAGWLAILYRSMDDAAFSLLSSQVGFAYFKEKEVIYRKGDPSNFTYVVLKGSVLKVLNVWSSSGFFLLLLLLFVLCSSVQCSLGCVILCVGCFVFFNRASNCML
jgi:hypothetical protein